MPQNAVPAEFGDLTFYDSFNNPVVIKNCHATVLTGRYTPTEGQTYILEGEDERWMWRYSAISGRYNATDQRKKLVPWTIQSPQELATMLIQAFWDGPFDVSILPNKLDSTAGQNLNRWLQLGENLPQSYTNPETIWDYTTPAEALERLVNMYGCRTVYQPIARNVLIAKIGEGDDLPLGPLGTELTAPNVSTVGAAPSSLVAVGAPVRVQLRMLLEPVAPEWHGAFYPINLLSYSPIGSNTPQKSAIYSTSPGGADPGTMVCAYCSYVDPATGKENGAGACINNSGTSTVTQMLTALGVKLLAYPNLKKYISVTIDGGGLQLNFQANISFNLQAYTTDGSECYYGVNTTQLWSKGTASWANCPPPHFMGVQATPQLSLNDARSLAADNVWKCYRIRNVDIVTLKTGLVIPYYGTLQRIQQLILQPKKVALITPQARIPGGINKGATVVAPAGEPNQGIFPEFYNGYANEQEATVRGSISVNIGNVFWASNPAALGGLFGGDPNTQPTDRVYVPFDIVPEEQMIKFHDYVYRMGMGGGANGYIRAPELTLETGCLLLDADNNQVVRWEIEQALGGNAPPYYEIHDDISVGVIGNYNPDNTFVSGNNYTLADLADAESRAQYYLTAMAIPFQLKTGQTKSYIGIVGIDPNGLIWQVTYSVGSGASTKASTNSEHSPVVAPLPARRRAENLPPNASAAAANLLANQLTNTVLPNPANPN